MDIFIILLIIVMLLANTDVTITKTEEDKRVSDFKKVDSTTYYTYMVSNDYVEVPYDTNCYLLDLENIDIIHGYKIGDPQGNHKGNLYFIRTNEQETFPEDEGGRYFRPKEGWTEWVCDVCKLHVHVMSKCGLSHCPKCHSTKVHEYGKKCDNE